MGVGRRVRRVMAAISILGVFGTAAAVSVVAPDGPAGASTPADVAVYGDSLAFDAADHLSFWLSLGGRVRLDLAAMPGTALCDWLPSMRALAAGHRPVAVVVTLTGNAFTPCMRDLAGVPLLGQAKVDKYRADAREVVNIFGPDTTVIFAGWPAARAGTVDPASDGVREAYRQVGAESPSAVFVDAGELVVGDDGSFVETRPCLMLEPCTGHGVNVVRNPDGVHLCPIARPAGDRCPVWASGAMRYSLSIAGTLLGSLAGAQSPSRSDHP